MRLQLSKIALAIQLIFLTVTHLRYTTEGKLFFSKSALERKNKQKDNRGGAVTAVRTRPSPSPPPGVDRISNKMHLNIYYCVINDSYRHETKSRHIYKL